VDRKRRIAAIAWACLAAGFAGTSSSASAVGEERDARADRLHAVATRLLSRKELDDAIVGIDVRSLTTGERVWSRHAARALSPASNLKLVTLALTLATLGPEHEFETPLIADGPIVEGGRLAGDLWIRGCGDPSLRPSFFDSEDEGAPLQPFVQALTLQGVKQIRGGLVVDARAFDDAFIPEGWPPDQLLETYAAPVAGLSLNGNCLRVRVSGRGGSPIAELRPEVWGWSLQSDLTTSADGNAVQVSLLPPDSRGVVRARGSVGADVGAVSLPVPIADPPLFFGLALRAAMQRAGIELTGTVRKVAAAEQPKEGARTLYTRRSPLLPALRLCGKESDNHIAEHLLKACARARFGRGTVEGGAQLVQELAGKFGVESSALRIVDGSGLSRLDQVTPEFLTALLAWSYEQPWRDEFIRCLPISGVDGTLDKRMTEPAMQYRVRAKTGFISQVSALSGYAMAGDAEEQEVFAFSILVNGFKGANAEMKKLQDDLCRSIVGLGTR